MIGVVIIICGLYMVLWGKTRDQPPVLKSECDKITPCEQQMKTTTTVQSSQDFLALDVAKEEKN